MHLVVNFDKPKGITSQEAVIRVKKLFRVKKAGHAGTLDPIATGVLLVCLGEATKITRFLSDLPKEYIATLKFGERTDTFDAEGKILQKIEDFSITEARVNEALEDFKGEIKQTPPMYSAVKVSGKPLYKLARKGIVVERAPKTVRIEELSVTGFHCPFLHLRISCSKGTYIRSLADDLGRSLGAGAHITELRRVRIGDFKAGDAAEIDELPGKQSALSSIDYSLRHLRQAVLTQRDFSLASHGTAIAHEGRFRAGEYLRLKDPEARLFAVGIVSNGRIKIERLLHLP